MANNDYLDSLNKLARKRQLELIKEQQYAIYRAYDKAAEMYYEKMINSVTSTGSASNAMQTEYAREMARRLDKIINDYNIRAAGNSIGLIEEIMSSAYEDVGLTHTPYAQAVNAITKAVRDDSARRIILGDIYKDGKGLDSRIWNAANRSGEKINEVIAACMAQQMSAVEMSKVLKDFMKPGGSTWDRNKIREKLGPGYAAWNKDVSYEALRLARTTITHSATLAIKEAGRVNPFMNSARWHSVHAIGRTCADCKERDGQVYSLAKLPFDHPNGLCWNEPVLDKSMDEIGKDLKDWVNGGKNSRMDEYWKAHGPKDIPLPSKLPKGDGPKTPEWYDKNFPKFKEELGDHWESGVREKLMNSPQFIQDWYRKNQDKLVYAGKDGDSAYYSPSNKWIKMNLVKDGAWNNSRGQYSTFFHEFGHLLDSQTLGARRGLSGNEVFYQAIAKDYEDMLVKFGKGSKPWPYVKGKIIEAQRAAGDLSSGVQDIYSGMSINEIRAGWGHSTEYWKRGNTAMEVASEAFAHMSSGYTNPERLAIMKEWFPTACEEFEKIVLSTLK